MPSRSASSWVLTPYFSRSGMNAIAHAVEALYAPDASPVIDLMAEEASGH